MKLHHYFLATVQHEYRYNVSPTLNKRCLDMKYALELVPNWVGDEGLLSPDKSFLV